MTMVGTKRLLHFAVEETSVGNTLVCNAYAYVVFQISGTFVGTVTFQATIDGANWHAVRATNLTSGTTATTGTVAGLYQLGVAGLGIVRANITAYTSGAITVYARGDVSG